MLRSSHWAGVEAVGSGGAFWAVFEEIHSVGPPVDTAAGIQGGCGDAQNVWSLTGWGFVPRKAKMTKHCDTFCLGSFKLPWMSGFLFPFFLSNSHTPVWGFTLRDDEGSSFSMCHPRFPFDWCSFRISHSDERSDTTAESETFLGTFLRFFFFIFPVRLPSPKCSHCTVRHELSAALTDHSHFNNLASFKSPLQSVADYSPSPINYIMSPSDLLSLYKLRLSLFFSGGFDYNTCTIIEMNHHLRHLEDKPDQQLNQVYYLTNISWKDCFATAAQ